MAFRLTLGLASTGSAIFAAVLVACHLLVPVGDEIKSTPPEAGSSDGELPDGAIDPCGPIPPPPRQRDDPSGPVLVFAAVKWAVDPAEDEAIFCASRGFDLDGLRTGPPPRCEENRACAPREVGATPVAPCDGPNGEDNALREGLAAINRIPSASQGLRAYDFNQAIYAGLGTSLVEIHEYSGKSDDESVVVHIYGAVGIEGIDAAVPDSGKPLEVSDLPRIWDGGQDAAWIIAQDSIVGEGSLMQARVQVPGYVRDYVLVIPQTGTLRVPVILGGRIPEARTGMLMGQLVPPRQPGDRYWLTHVRGGLRFATREILSVVGSAHNPGKAYLQLCDPESRDVYEAFIRAPLCARADLPPDNGPPNAAIECGDLSGAFHAVYIDSRFSRNDAGRIVVGPSQPFGTKSPCTDLDAGKEWCDDCAWDASKRCDLNDALH